MNDTRPAGKRVSTTRETSGSSGSFSTSELTPYTRHGTDTEGGKHQYPQLHCIYESPPAEARYHGPVYFLTKDEVRYHDEIINEGAEYKFSDGSIATVLQEQVKDEGRVLYPVKIESDEVRNKGIGMVRQWLFEFTDQYLPVSPVDCTLYYSGGRSIHLHAPLFVSEIDKFEQIKELVSEFNSDTAAKLDTATFKEKQQFRIPGTEHHSGGSKIQIGWNWSKGRIAREINQSQPSPPDLYAYVLERDFGCGIFHLFANVDQYLFNPTTTDDSPTVDPLPWEPSQPKYAGNDSEKWKAYNDQYFSPYAKARTHERSVFVGRVIGGEFIRRNDPERRILIPCFAHFALGGDPEFHYHCKHLPLYLSEPDYAKRVYTPGERFLIIGGGNGESRIFEINAGLASILHTAVIDKSYSKELNFEEGKDIVFDTLDTWTDFDLGSGGKNGPRGERSADSGRSADTRAAHLQRQIEQHGLESLTAEYDQMFLIACRLLKSRGWDGTVEWFKRVYGDEFNPQKTRSHLRRIVEQWPGQYPVEIPSGL